MVLVCIDGEDSNLFYGSKRPLCGCQYQNYNGVVTTPFGYYVTESAPPHQIDEKYLNIL